MPKLSKLKRVEIKEPRDFNSKGAAELGAETKIRERITGQTAVFLAFNKHITEELRSKFAQPARADITASVYQQAVYDFITNGSGNAIVEAVAGSGKTTTLLQALHLLPCAKEDVTISTIHALGFAAIRKAFSKVIVDDQKVMNMLDQLLPIDRSKGWVPKSVFAEIRATRKIIARLVSLCKFNLIDNPTLETLRELSDYYSLDVNGSLEENYHLVKTVLDKCLDQTNIVDFDDMIWIPVVANLPMEQFDWVFVDEAQDLSRCQQEIVAKVLKPTGRLIAVGDSRQAIYGFSGADSDSMRKLAERFDAQPLPLSISYRCPRLHVERAKELVPQIEAAPTAIDGTIEDVEERQLYTVVRDGDMVLCRTNKPLIATAFTLIRQGIKAVVRGRDIGQGLVAFIDRLKATDLNDLTEKLRLYEVKEGDKLLLADKEVQYELLLDKCDTIRCFISESTTVDDMKQRIEKLFSDNIAGVVLSSVHKAKGLESQRIFILRPDLIPFPKARKPHEIEAEQCISYVALTRSKSELYFVHEKSNSKDSKETVPET